MAVGDGTTWDEATPVDGTSATSIDDYNRDVRKGVRGRMALEHEWPASQSATSEAGVHKFMTMQQQATAPTIAGTQTGAIWVDTGDTLQYTNSAGDSPIGGGSHMIARGFELEYSAAGAFTVLAGTLYHGLGLVNKTANTTLTFATASDWWDGAADSYAGGAGWCYVGVNQAGSIKLLGANPADSADSAGNTDGTLLYWSGTTYYWRIIGAVYVDTSDECDHKWYQHGNKVVFDVAQSITTTVPSAAWRDLDCSVCIPATSRYGTFNYMLYRASGSRATSVIYRPKGTTWSSTAPLNTSPEGNGFGVNHGATNTNEPRIAGNFSGLLSSAQVMQDYSNYVPAYYCFAVWGYEMEIR